MPNGKVKEYYRLKLGIRSGR